MRFRGPILGCGTALAFAVASAASVSAGVTPGAPAQAAAPPTVPAPIVAAAPPKPVAPPDLAPLADITAYAAMSLNDLEARAVRNDRVAQYEVGYRYERIKSYDQALTWYQKSAAQGYAPAQNDLGSIYYVGLMAPKDLGRAMHLYSQAAAQGLPIAEDNLASMLAVGEGTSPNVVEAYKLFARASRTGYAPAAYDLSTLTGMMAPDQLQLAQAVDKISQPLAVSDIVMAGVGGGAAGQANAVQLNERIGKAQMVSGTVLVSVAAAGLGQKPGISAVTVFNPSGVTGTASLEIFSEDGVYNAEANLPLSGGAVQVFQLDATQYPDIVAKYTTTTLAIRVLSPNGDILVAGLGAHASPDNVVIYVNSMSADVSVYDGDTLNDCGSADAGPYVRFDSVCQASMAALRTGKVQILRSAGNQTKAPVVVKVK